MKSIFTLLWRDFRGGELTILILSLMLATATVTSITLFTDRIQNSILDEATEFLAADAQIRSSMPIAQSTLDAAATHGLETAQIQSFRAMAFSDNGMQLVAAKGVSAGYPLKGAVTVADTPFGIGSDLAHGPEPGDLWLASRLFGALDIAIGDTVSVGDAQFTVTKALIKEPDAPESFFGVAPRAMMNLADIPRTGAIQPGSRVNFSVLLMGDAASLDTFHQAVLAMDSPHTRWVVVEQSNRNIGDALARAQQFLLLAGSLSVLLCGVAIAMAARRYAGRQAGTVALLKTFGQTPDRILLRYAIVLLCLGVVSTALGAFSGWGLHLVILIALANLLPEGLSAANPGAYLSGSLAGLIALLAFAAPPLLALRQVPPARVLREAGTDGFLNPKIAAGIGLLAIVALIYFYSRDLAMTLILALGCIVIIGGGSLLAWALMRAGKSSVSGLGSAWRIGFANLQRHQGLNAIQITIFAALIMLMLILVALRTELIQQWQRQLPDDAPNHFLFNVFNDEKPQIQALMDAQNIPHRPFYPMLRGRLTEVNGESVKPRVEAAESSMDYQRELNLTWATTLGEDNTVTAGTWHGAASDEPAQIEVSAEEEYAKGLHLKLGDTLRFSIAGQQVDAKLTSIRDVQWESMNPNFFMIFSQPLLDNTATNWLTSFYLAENQKTWLNTLGRQFPTVSVVELDQMIGQIQNIIGQVSLAVEFVLVLVLAAGLVVLVTSIQASLDIRFQESAILRTMGAPRELVNRILLIEFAGLGFMAGLLAAIGAQAALFYLQTQVFDLRFEPSIILSLCGPLLGALLIGFTGWASTRRVTQHPPLTILRNL
ncbi:ABC transporter permease [Teredinibacter turnerae]|uniref:ABC transporter permease n=1 Tax=Teredinibacter turnerae TaxID=2426 RepID=UPI0003694DBA|nr:FtsX-like permease family protein [Teredinibacter turnerae]